MRVCSRWVPRGVHCICCLLAKRGAGRSQPVVATGLVSAARRTSSRASAGVLQPRVFRGRVLRAVATAARSEAPCAARSVPFGKHCRSSPPVVLVRRRAARGCGDRGMQTRSPVATRRVACGAISAPWSQVSDRRRCSGKAAIVQVMAQQAASAPWPASAGPFFARVPLPVARHPRQMEQHREARRALHERGLTPSCPAPPIRSPSQRPGTARQAASAGRWLIMISGAMKDLPPTARARPRHSARARPVRRQAVSSRLEPRRGPGRRAPRSDRLVADAHGVVLGEVDRQPAGDLRRSLHAEAHRRSDRRPWRRPFHGTAGPGTALPSGAAITPASRSSTWRRSASLVTRSAGFGRRAARQAVPLRGGGAVLEAAAAGRRVAFAARARSSTGRGRAGGRARARRVPGRASHAISSRSANDR